MSFYTFQQFPPIMQRYWMLRHGTYLAQRWENEGGVNLYHCGGDGRGFFVEVGVDNGRGQAVVLRSFIEAEPLEEYSHYIQLPGQ